jgi:hypothetical protein
MRPPEQPVRNRRDRASRFKEIKDMGQTIADSLIEEGELRQARKMLLQLLKDRFKKVPKTVKSRIEATMKLKPLEKATIQVRKLDKLDDLLL